MRECPRCAFPMRAVTRDGIELDHCLRCGGTFLDPGEEAETLGMPASPEVWRTSSVTEELGLSRLRCPVDRTRMAAYAVAFGDRRVEVDLCGRCSGMWLDAEEGVKLRDVVMRAGQSAETDFVPEGERPGVTSYLLQLFTGLPMEVWNPTHRRPAVTIGLIAVIYTVFLGQAAVLFSGGIPASQRLIDTFALTPASVFAGQRLWTLATNMFLHLGVMHVLGNSYFLYLFGDNVEDAVRKGRFLLIFFASGIAGAALQAVTQADPSIPMAGASAAIAGLMGAYLVMFPQVKLYLVRFMWVPFFVRLRLGIRWYLALWVGFNLLMAAAGRGESVAWMAHVGGFAAGTLVALRYRVRPLAERLRV